MFRLNTQAPSADVAALLAYLRIDTPETSKKLRDVLGTDYHDIISFFDTTWQRAGGLSQTFGMFYNGPPEQAAPGWMLQGKAITDILSYVEWPGGVAPEHRTQFSYLAASTIADREFTYGPLDEFWPRLSKTGATFLGEAFNGLHVTPLPLLRAVNIGQAGMSGEYARLIAGGVYDLTLRVKPNSVMFSPADIMMLYQLGVPWNYANPLAPEWAAYAQNIVRFHQLGVDIDYAVAAVEAGGAVDEIAEAWTNGVSIEYAIETFEAPRGLQRTDNHSERH